MEDNNVLMMQESVRNGRPIMGEVFVPVKGKGVFRRVKR